MDSPLHFDALPGKDIKALYKYHWPGNVRELQNVLRRYVTFNNLDFMSLPDIDPPVIQPQAPPGVITVSDSVTELPLTDASARFEKQLILSALNNCRWHREKAAEKLGISRRTLYRKMLSHGLVSAI